MEEVAVVQWQVQILKDQGSLGGQSKTIVG